LEKKVHPKARINEECSLKAHNAIQNEESGQPLVLVVEDDVDILSFIAMEFAEDYRVLKAADGHEGLELALEHMPDLVVTDLMMPAMDGIELCRQLKGNPITAHIPVIMLTARTSQENQLEGLNTGADDYVTKPFNIVLLQARVANLLEGRRRLRAQFAQNFAAGGLLTPLGNGRDEEFIEHAAQVVGEHYSDWNFRSEEFAAALGMSLRTLQRKLKDETGLSTGGFIAEFRMRRATELLALTSRTVTEIAFEVGYDESSSFSRVFKKRFNMSPSEYRSTHTTS
jgi:DNA-binding response OmpR family regulator